LGHGAEGGGIAEDFGFGDACADELPSGACGVYAEDAASAAVDVAGDVAHEFLGHGDLHSDVGLQQAGRGLLYGVLDGHGGGDLEGHVGGVHGVEGAVEEFDDDVHHGMGGDDTAREGLVRA